MISPLSGQVVIVTGAARRVGAAIARRLHAAGATVAVHYHASAADAGALAGEMNALRPESAAIFPADLLQVPQLTALVEAVPVSYTHLDVYKRQTLLHCAPG